MLSGVYEGWVRHRRHAPVRHDFRYRLFMMQLDLDELDIVFARCWLWSTRFPNLAWFRRADYFGRSDRPLKGEVLDRIAADTGQRPDGKVLLLTHLRYFGYCFNPVSFYFCHQRDGRLHSILAEITNTPWNERFAYVLHVPDDAGSRHEFAFEKRFHVSPFMPMDMRYRWVFSLTPTRTLVHMESTRGEERTFDATLNLTRREISSTSLARVLVLYPLMSLGVILGIHLQALRLWLKRTPFHVHPAKRRISA